MKYFLFCLLFGVVLFCYGAGYEAKPPHKTYTLEQFLDTTAYVGGCFSYDNKRILFSSNETGIFNAYSMSISGAHKENKPTRITNSIDHAIHVLSYFPNDDRVLYAEDENGNEITHIYLREANGAVRDLTPNPLARTEFYGWAHDRKSFFYESNERDNRFMDIYEMDIESFTPRLLFKNEEGYILGAVSADKRYLAFARIVSTTRCDMYLFDVETEALIKLTTQEEDFEAIPQAFSLDSNSLYYLTDENSTFTYVKKINLMDGEVTTEHKQAWDITRFYLSHNGTYHIITVNEEACQAAKIFNHHDKSPLELPKELQHNVIGLRMSRTEDLILFSICSDTSPTNFYLYNLEKKKYKKLTNSLSPEINGEDLVSSSAIRYRATDGVAIPALLYMPKNASPENKVPALVWVHGGPGGQSTQVYNSTIQFLVNQGYAILAVNNRGSTGYGKTFYGMADRKHGEIDLQDCIDGKKHLIATGLVDPDRIGIMGGSYGGYLTLAALVFQPDEMAVGIDLFGVSNWVRTLENLPSWWERQRQMMYQKIGDPTEDRDYLLSISPLFHADRIKKPLMVLQGANDPRVLQVESDEIIAEVEKSGVPYRYIIFDDEGHGFTKDRNRLIAGKAILEFLQQYL